jgi:beta-phosphoglucomutase-like phosphatase (HAD superfamily)
MDRLRDLLEAVRSRGLATGRLRGLLYILIGKRIELPDGTSVSSGMTWRELAAVLKRYRWDREAVSDLGLEPATLPPRDREKYWYTAISRANPSSVAAAAEAEPLIAALRELGYVVGSASGGSSAAASG